MQDAVARAREFCANKENKLELRIRFDRVVREFHQPPSSDNEQREAIIKSPANIVFLFMDAKLASKNMKLRDIIPQFDTEKKGVTRGGGGA